jgi:hypothetical protein
MTTVRLLLEGNRAAARLARTPAAKDTFGVKHDRRTMSVWLPKHALER